MHRDMWEDTTAFIKGLPFNTGQELVSLAGTLRQQHFGVTPVRFEYIKRSRDGSEMIFDGMCYISFDKLSRVKSVYKQVQRLLLRREG